MKIVVAPDSFKGNLTAQEVGVAIKNGIQRGIQETLNETAIKVIPMADGGEGTLQCLIDATQGELFQAHVQNPLGKEIEAIYGILGDGLTCVIEMAISSGLYLMDETERKPLIATTYGFGQLIKEGLDRGCRRFILGIGGSATNDGGAGMLQSLGFQLLDDKGLQIGFGGGELGNISTINVKEADPRLAQCTFTIACDVDNPFIGSKGASYVFGPQKGATPEMVEQLDRNLSHFADLIQSTLGIRIHDIPGAGAAGGLAGALLAFMNGKLRSGVQIVTEITQLEDLICDADLVITGEGQVDFQTAHGKTPCGVANLAQKYNVPTIVLAGSIGQGIETLYEQGVTAVFSIVNQPMTLDQAMNQTDELLSQAAEQIIRMYTLNRGLK